VLVAFVVSPPKVSSVSWRRLAGPVLTMTAPLLEVEGLVKRFGGFIALNRVTLHVKAASASASSDERLRQDDAHQLPSPAPSIPTAAASSSKASTSRPCRPSPDPARIVRTLPDSKPFSSMTVIENLHTPPSGVTRAHGRLHGAIGSEAAES